MRGGGKLLGRKVIAHEFAPGEPQRMCPVWIAVQLRHAVGKRIRGTKADVMAGDMIAHAEAELAGGRRHDGQPGRHRFVRGDAQSLLQRGLHIKMQPGEKGGRIVEMAAQADLEPQVQGLNLASAQL